MRRNADAPRTALLLALCAVPAAGYERTLKALAPGYLPKEDTLVQLREGVNAWPSLPESTLSDWPPHLLGQDGLLFGSVLMPGQGAAVAPRWREGPALLYAWMFRCPPCAHADGGLKEALLSDGFVKTNCAPTFTTEHFGPHYRMQGYVREVRPGDIYNITAPGAAEYVAFGVVWSGHTVCSKRQTMSTCAAAGEAEMQCTWHEELGMCDYNYCPHASESDEAAAAEAMRAHCLRCPPAPTAPTPVPPTPVPPTPAPTPFPRPWLTPPPRSDTNSSDAGAADPHPTPVPPPAAA